MPDLDPQSDENTIAKIDKSFEMLCASMEEAGVSNPKKLSLFEFYSRIEYFESKRKRSKVTDEEIQ